MAIWWILLVISVVVYLFFAGFVLPNAFFKADYGALLSHDRGIMNFKEKDGKSIVYEPPPQFRKYISQYILSLRNGKKAVICKLKENFSYLDYDIVLFNSFNKAFRIVNVKENIKTSGFTRLTELPAKTAYISLIINFADGVDVKAENDVKAAASNVKGANKRRLGTMSVARLFRGLVFYSLCACVPAALEVFFLKLCLANIFGDVFWLGFMQSTGGTFVTLMIALAAAVINFAAAFGHILIQNRAKRT